MHTISSGSTHVRLFTQECIFYTSFTFRSNWALNSGHWKCVSVQFNQRSDLFPLQSLLWLPPRTMRSSYLTCVYYSMRERVVVMKNMNMHKSWSCTTWLMIIHDLPYPSSLSFYKFMPGAYSRADVNGILYKALIFPRMLVFQTDPRLDWFIGLQSGRRLAQSVPCSLSFLSSRLVL